MTVTDGMQGATAMYSAEIRDSLAIKFGLSIEKRMLYQGIVDIGRTFNQYTRFGVVPRLISVLAGICLGEYSKQ